QFSIKVMQSSYVGLRSTVQFLQLSQIIWIKSRIAKSENDYINSMKKFLSHKKQNNRKFHTRSMSNGLGSLNLQKRPTPSPTVLNNKFLPTRNQYHSEDINNNILFDIIIKETDKGLKKCVLIGLNLTTNKIFNMEYIDLNTSNRKFKIFVANNLINIKNNGINIDNLYIPKRINSKTLTDLITLSFPNIKVQWYLKSEITNLFLKSDYTNFIKEINERKTLGKSILSKLIIYYNDSSPHCNIGKSSRKVTAISHTKRDIHTSTENNHKKDLFGWHRFNSSNYYDCIDSGALTIEINKLFEYYKDNFTQPFFVVNAKIKFPTGNVRSIGFGNVTTLTDKETLIKTLAIFLEREDIHTVMSYDEGDIDESKFPKGSLSFDFKPLKTIEGTKYANYTFPIKKDIVVKDINKKINFNGLDLPKTMDLSKWPNLKLNKDKTSGEIRMTIKNKNNQSYDIIGHMIINDGENVITFNRAVDNSIIKIFTVTDSMGNTNDPNLFKRIVEEKGNQTVYVYENNETVCVVQDKKFGFISKIAKNKTVNLKSISTLDLETRMDTNNRLIPICMSYYNNKKLNTFLFKDDWQEEMLAAFKTLLKSTNHGKKFYVHNLAHFDSVFILDTLSKLGKIDIIMRDDKIMKLKITFKIPGKNTEYSISFLDSLLMLPNSLDNLSKAFNIENKKSVFPLKFTNGAVTPFNYIGAVPGYEYFYNTPNKKFTKDDYKKYCKDFNNNWDFNKELKNYCEIDCLALHDILTLFAKMIHNEFSVDITRYVSLSSITFAIFRTNFLPENKIPNITCTKLHYILKQAYTGGYCDVFKPEGKNIHSYDINSLYPSAMAKFDMPTGTPLHILGDPYKFTKDPFGFVFAEVTAPDLKVPIIQTRVQTSGGVRTVAPIGTFKGWYLLDELINAKKYGYTFKISEAYLFERLNIFKEYIHRLYTIKSSYTPDDPMYFIAKLLMNSLYGRFGMDPITIKYSVLTPEESEEKLKNSSCIEATTLPSGNVLFKENKPLGEFSNLNTSVPISAAIAAYSRMIMSEYLIKYADNLYAVDTDGIKVDTEIDKKYVSDKELGLMKHEYTFKEAVFVAPKVYGGLFDKPYKNKVEIVKVKGLKEPIQYSDLKDVYIKSLLKLFIILNFLRQLALSTIVIKEQPYSLRVSSFKRVLVFNESGKIISTLPLKLENDKIVSNPHLIVNSEGNPSAFKLSLIKI
uniref:Probable DNA polymerase n=1 Tax=Ascobolus immersus TaxID=5191 RepID=DPOM_ASCIM